jgi:hypothetical protein
LADLSTHNLSTGRLAELEGPPRCEQGSTSCKLPLALRRGFAFSEAAVRATFASETCGVWSSSSKVGIERRWRAQWIAETYSWNELSRNRRNTIRIIHIRMRIIHLRCWHFVALQLSQWINGSDEHPKRSSRSLGTSYRVSTRISGQVTRSSNLFGSTRAETKILLTSITCPPTLLINN